VVSHTLGGNNPGSKSRTHQMKPEFRDANCWSLSNSRNWYTFNTGMLTIFILPMLVIVTACYVYVYLVAKRHAMAINQVIFHYNFTNLFG
jgi:hypothetical protein